MNKVSVLPRLLRYVNGQYKKDANYDIALSLLTHYSVIPDKTITELSELCFVSPASISRFVKTLGFDSFPDFKAACKNTLAIENTDYAPEVMKANRKDVTEIIDRYTEHVINNIDYAHSHFDFNQIDVICQNISECDEVLMLGLEFSTLLAQHFQNRMALMNKYIKVALSSEEQLEAAKNLKEGSVVFILSLEGGYFYHNLEIIDILVRKKVKLVVISMNYHNKIINGFENHEIIVCSNNNSNTEGRFSLLYVLEILIMYYCIYFSR